MNSIVLSCLPSARQERKMGLRKLGKALGIPKSSLHMIVKQLQRKRAALEGNNMESVDSIVFSQVVKRKGWRF